MTHKWPVNNYHASLFLCVFPVNSQLSFFLSFIAQQLPWDFLHSTAPQDCPGRNAHLLEGSVDLLLKEAWVLQAKSHFWVTQRPSLKKARDVDGSSKPRFANTGFQSSFRSLLLGTIFTQGGYKSRPSSQANSQKPLQRTGFYSKLSHYPYEPQVPHCKNWGRAHCCCRVKWGGLWDYLAQCLMPGSVSFFLYVQADITGSSELNAPLLTSGFWAIGRILDSWGWKMNRTTLQCHSSGKRGKYR